MSYNFDSTFKGPPTTLIATNLPSGKELYTTPGQSDNAASLEAYARRCGDCPEQIYIVTAESVGLEWHSEGKLLEWSERYRRGSFCVLVNDQRQATASE